MGTKKPNQYSLYDVAGNVWEWTADWSDGNYYQESQQRNPRGPATGSSRALRGGSWEQNVAADLRAAYRYGNDPGYRYYYIGFRPAR